MSSIARILACAQTQGAKRPTPTQSTCLYYDHDNEASKCVLILAIVVFPHLLLISFLVVEYYLLYYFFLALYIYTRKYFNMDIMDILYT